MTDEGTACRGGAAMLPPLVSTAARRYALVLLFAAYTVNYVDRQVITILQDPIKHELGLSDTQLGFVTGLSFALFYALMGVPIARMADIRSRKRIIVAAMTLWSAMTMLCAAATGFVSLLLLRFGVGVGEAGLTPPAHSLISDYYEPHRRATALSIYSASGTVGLMVGFLAGGWINQYFGWRAAIVVVGGPGILLALLMWRTMAEPRRGQYDPPPAAMDDGTKPAESVFALLRQPSFRCIALACGAHTFVNYGQGNWTPPFLGRVHGMGSGEIGTWLALLAAGPGLIGMLSSGYIADRLARVRPQARIEVAIASMVLIVPFQVGSVLAHGTAVALCCFAGSFVFAGAYLGPLIATAHALVPARRRASASAVILLGVNLIGLGLGPLAVGWLSDLWRGAGAGSESLRYAMLAIVPFEGVAIAFLLRATKHGRVIVAT